MQAVQVNVEYFFRLFYDLVYGAHASALDYASLKALSASLWTWIVAIGYTVSILGLLVVTYATIRLRDIRNREEVYYRTLVAPPEGEGGGMSPRWQHIETLAGGTSPSEWREAILEADIMLDDALSQAGYTGDTIADKLKSVSPGQLLSLDEAWEAHKVRNQIAHQGSFFDLSETITRRTIARFETVLRELRAI